MRRRLELLSPARNLECGMAAIDHGADAVYIGPPQFGARAAAGNSVEDIATLCRYAHQYDAKVYATVNTLLHDEELQAASTLLHELTIAGVDAILIQDMRLLSIVVQRSTFNVQCSTFNVQPSLHASTQADNRTPEKVRWLASQGFKRVVLARELSVDEVRAVHEAVPGMELEVFVHGALCVSYSGLCYASEHCFGRSANRGECAQFCRMKFDLLDADGNEIIHQRHLLSLRDLNLSSHLADLIAAGATSFKIEGRLKDISYVKNVTAAYSQLLDRFIEIHPADYERASLGRCRYTFTPDLSRTFNRGYTTYFISGRQSNMASFYTPKAIGQYVGKVKELRGRSFTVSGTASFVNGDGLCYFNSSHELEGFRVNRAEGNRLFPSAMPIGLHPGTQLYRSSDQAMERTLSKASAERKIPLTMRLSATDGGDIARVELAVSDGQRSTTAILNAPLQLARTPQQAYIARELAKLGGTPYECCTPDVPDDFPYFIPASQLSALRRQSIQQLQAVHTANNDGKELSSPSLPPHSPFTPPSLPLNSSHSLPLMQCRYCLRHELGCCVKHCGKRPSWREPLFLRLSDGRRFRLDFDCRHCQMNVLATDERDN